MKKTTKKKGIRKLEQTIEVRTDLMIGLMEYVEMKYIEEGKDVTKISQTIQLAKDKQKQQQQQHLENRIETKLYMREYRKKNAERIKELGEEYRKNNPERMKEIGKRYREKKKLKQIGVK